MISSLIVDATREPTRIAPRNSQTAAARIACLKLRERELTEVANEFATSLAPIPYASRNEVLRLLVGSPGVTFIDSHKRDGEYVVERGKT